MYIYKITNLINNKIYIGLSTRPVEESTDYYGSGIQIKEAIQKYGKDNFTKEILYIGKTIQDISNAEKRFISEYNSTDNNIGYNILDGGYGGNGHYERTKVHKKHMSNKIKKVIRENWNDPKQIEIRSARISKRNATYCKGRTLSEDTKRKIAISCRKRFLGTKQRKVICPHCGKEGGVSNMTRYHFDNCKKLTKL